jgi:DNA phosphorothioation-associated putative methyltransferase
MSEQGDLIGKRVGTSRYLHRDATVDIDEPSATAINQALTFAIGRGLIEWNVVRISLTDQEIAFLHYPSFEHDPFPSLSSSCLVKLGATPVITYRNFRNSLNPPILHRKELLLPMHDTRRSEWRRTTDEAEAIGLFDETSRIGFRQEWLRKIAERGYALVGDRFVPNGNSQGEGGSDLFVGTEIELVERHRTALSRSNLSAPVQSLLRFGVLTKTMTFLDYGCGRGDDLRGLVDHGYDGRGWDPHFASDAPKHPSDVVNLGFVLNVIEDSDERDQTLREAFKLAQSALCVAVMTEGSTVRAGTPYRDGYLTSRKTFQKYFSQTELKAYIESVLGRSAVLVAPGIAFVFSNDELEEKFRLERVRSSRVYIRNTLLPRSDRLTTPTRFSASAKFYQTHIGQIDTFWKLSLRLGRYPMHEEAAEFADLITAAGSLTKIVRLCQQNYDEDSLELARSERIEDLTVYFALQCFSQGIRTGALGGALKQDVKCFFGSLHTAQDAGAKMLRSIASVDVINDACQSAAQNGLGLYIQNQSLQVHTSLVSALPAVLRVYIGAASTIYGDVHSADLVKIHVNSGKLTLLEYDDFQAPLSYLRRRVKVHLRTQQIEVFEYNDRHEPTALLNKSEFLNEEYPEYSKLVAFDKKLARLRVLFSEYGPRRSELENLLTTERLQLAEYDLIPLTTVPDLDAPCGKNFSYRDLLFCGETALSSGLSNTPEKSESYNALHALAQNVLDPMIDYFGAIRLTYGFCSSCLAREIKRRGVGRIAPDLDQHSAHEVNRHGNLICERGGAAVDFIVDDEDMYAVAQWIKENLPFDRLYLYGRDLPIHISYGPQMTGQVTFVERHGNRTFPRSIGDFSKLA